MIKKKVFILLFVFFLATFSFYFLEAKTENELNIYSGRKSFLIEPLIDEFKKNNKNIKVNIVTGKSDEFIERLKLEGKNTKADILLTTDVARLTRAKNNNLFKKTNQIEEINVISLSECIEKYDIEKIDFLKMDCEGAEFEIILGLTDETLKKIKKMSIEVHMMRKEFAVEDLMEFLQQHNFTVNIKSTFYEMTSMLYAENKEFSI